MSFYTGLQFKETFPNEKFYSLINKDLKYYDRYYINGLNLNIVNYMNCSVKGAVLHKIKI